MHTMLLDAIALRSWHCYSDARTVCWWLPENAIVCVCVCTVMMIFRLQFIHFV